MSGDIAGDPEENESLLFEEIVQENKKLYKCSICLRLLSRKQRIESHLQLVYGKGKLFPSSRISFDQSLLSSVFKAQPLGSLLSLCLQVLLRGNTNYMSRSRLFYANF